MTTFGDMLFQLGGMPALSGVPVGPKAHYYFVDPVNGSDTNDGTSVAKPKKTLAAAEDLCVANQHDTVFFIAGADASAETAAIVWDKAYTHLIGIGCQLPGVGQRCRAVWSAAVAATTCITFSGNGCIVKNMQFNNEKASGACGVAIVSGARCYFENVFFMCPTSVTAASYSLKLSGGECAFVRCTIGQHTLVRSAATHGLWIVAGGNEDACRNKFINCEFLSWSSTTGHALVTIETDITYEAWTLQFEDCLFANIVSGAGTLAVAIVDGATDAGHRVYIRGRGCGFNGVTAVANPLTRVVWGESCGTGTQSGLLMTTINES